MEGMERPCDGKGTHDWDGRKRSKGRMVKIEQAK